MEDRNLEIGQAYEEFEQARQKLLGLVKEGVRGPFPDHELTGRDGSKTKLSELFGDRDDLIVVHNMGVDCPYCTLWADGFTGLLRHLESRAAFVVVSPDAPEVQAAVARERGWPFRMFSTAGSDFNREAGFEENGSPMPGFTTFHRTPQGGLERVSRGPFGPGDSFCSVWHFFDHLADGAAGWQPEPHSPGSSG